jgi:GH43 family beta-xylosidase
VSFAVASDPLGPWEHAAEPGPVVLRERPPHALGPGHNSFVRAPDGSEWLVYHAWDAERRARRMCIDPLIWTENGPRCLGPTMGSQHVSAA